jgi:mono/diheme cytochrome c family protein
MKSLLPIALCTGLAACSDVSMTRQNKYAAYSPSSLWRDGASARPIPEGAVARGDLAREEAASDPPPATTALLARGQERYHIFCEPCHGMTGEGDGVVVARGFPAPAAFGLARLRQAAARHLFDAITNGYGLMYPYAAQIPPEDRWAIVAYVRALQLAANAPIAMAPEAGERLR